MSCRSWEARIKRELDIWKELSSGVRSLPIGVTFLEVRAGQIATAFADPQLRGSVGLKFSLEVFYGIPSFLSKKHRNV